jgi:uncharacterized protein (DUF2252 family)
MSLMTTHNRKNRVNEAIKTADESLPHEATQLKYDKMRASPFAFFRETSHLFWADMYNDWRFALFGGRVETQTWLQGDAHVYNFGAFFDHAKILPSTLVSHERTTLSA